MNSRARLFRWTVYVLAGIMLAYALAGGPMWLLLEVADTAGDKLLTGPDGSTPTQLGTVCDVLYAPHYTLAGTLPWYDKYLMWWWEKGLYISNLRRGGRPPDKVEGSSHAQRTH